MATALRELAIVLGLEMDEDAEKEAQKSLEAFEDNIAAFAVTAVAAFGAAALAVTEMGREMAVSIDSGARQLGISRQEFQQWEAVARSAGAEGEKIIDVMANLQEKARDAALDPRGQMAKTFEQLGIAAKDANGQIRSGPQLMREAADALARMGPGTEQTATAMALFGDAGRELLPVLGQGSAAINRVIADFEALGGGLSDEAIESSLEFNRSLLQLKATLAGALSPLLKELNPIFTGIAEGITEATAKLRELMERTTATRTAVIALITGAITALGYAIYANIPAIVAWVIAWAPFILGMTIAAGTVIALSLAIDDLITFLEGGDSAIGAWLDTLFGVGAANAVLLVIKDTVGSITTGFFRALDAANAMRNGLSIVFGAVTSFADQAWQRILGLEQVFYRVRDAVTAFLQPLREAAQLVGSLPQMGLDVAQGAVADGGRVVSGGAGVAQSVIAQAQPRLYAAASTVGRAVNVTRTTAATVQVHVNGVVDPNVFQRQLERTIGPVLAQVTRDAADEGVTGADL